MTEGLLDEVGVEGEVKRKRVYRELIISLIDRYEGLDEGMRIKGQAKESSP